MMLQDTVVGMAALAGLASKLSTTDPQVNIRLIYGARGKNIQVNRGNTMMLQRFEVSMSGIMMFMFLFCICTL